MPLPWDAKVLVGILGVSGTLHLVKPATYEPLMPSFVPAHRQVIYGSGVAELLCAAGMLHPRTRRVAGYATRGAARRRVPRQPEDGRRRAALAQHAVQADRLRPVAAAVADDPGGPEGRPDRFELARSARLSGAPTASRLPSSRARRTS